MKGPREICLENPKACLVQTANLCSGQGSGQGLDCPNCLRALVYKMKNGSGKEVVLAHSSAKRVNLVSTGGCYASLCIPITDTVTALRRWPE